MTSKAGVGDARLAVLNNNRHVGMGGQRGLMGDDEDGGVWQPRAHAARDQVLMMRVERRGWLVEDQHARPSQKRPGDRHPLAFPDGEGEAALAGFRSQAVRQAAQRIGEAGRLGRRRNLGIAYGRQCESDIGRDGIVEQMRRLVHQNHLAAQVGQGDSPQVAAVIQNASFVGVDIAHQKVGKRGLSDPAGTEDRAGASARNLQRDILQHRIAVVAHRHLLQADRLPQWSQRQRCLAFGHLRRCVQDLEDASKRDTGRGEAGAQTHQCLDRRQQTRMIRHERHQRADGHAIVDDEMAAVQEHHGGRGGQKGAGQRTGQERRHLRAQHGAHEGVAAAPEPLHLVTLGPQRGHHAHAENRVDEMTADVGAAFAHFLRQTGQAALIVKEGDDARRHEHRSHQKQPPFHPQHHGDAARKKKHVAQHRQQRIGGHALGFTHVGIEARHQIAEPKPGIEAGRKPLQVAEQRDAHVEQHGGGNLQVFVAYQDVHREAGHRRHEHQAGQGHQHVHVALQQGFVDQQL